MKKGPHTLRCVDQPVLGEEETDETGVTIVRFSVGRVRNYMLLLRLYKNTHRQVSRDG